MAKILLEIGIFLLKLKGYKLCARMIQLNLSLLVIFGTQKLNNLKNGGI
jgi:hypothetical protein